MKAADVIFAHFRELTGKGEQFDALRTPLLTCLGVAGGHDVWRQEFADVEFAYDPEEWKGAAIKRIPSDPADIDEEQTLRYEVLGDPRWFYFQHAAFEQRKAVMSYVQC